MEALIKKKHDIQSRLVMYLPLSMYSTLGNCRGKDIEKTQYHTSYKESNTIISISIQLVELF